MQDILLCVRFLSLSQSSRRFIRLLVSHKPLYRLLCQRELSRRVAMAGNLDID